MMLPGWQDILLMVHHESSFPGKPQNGMKWPNLHNSYVLSTPLGLMGNLEAGIPPPVSSEVHAIHTAKMELQNMIVPPINWFVLK